MGTEIWCLIGVNLLLVGLVVFQNLQIQKLVDKLMSRSFAEYQQAAKPMTENKITLPQEPPEDLRALQEFRILG